MPLLSSAHAIKHWSAIASAIAFKTAKAVLLQTHRFDVSAGFKKAQVMQIQ